MFDTDPSPQVTATLCVSGVPGSANDTDSDAVPLSSIAGCESVAVTFDGATLFSVSVFVIEVVPSPAERPTRSCAVALGLSSAYVWLAVNDDAFWATPTELCDPSPQWTVTVRADASGRSNVPPTVTGDPSETEAGTVNVLNTAGVVGGVLGGLPVVPNSVASGDEHATGPGCAIALKTAFRKLLMLLPTLAPKSHENANPPSCPSTVASIASPTWS